MKNKKFSKLVKDIPELKKNDVEFSKEQIKEFILMSREDFKDSLSRSNRSKYFIKNIKKIWIQEYGINIAKEILGLVLRGKTNSSKTSVEDSDKLLDESRENQKFLLNFLLGKTKY